MAIIYPRNYPLGIAGLAVPYVLTPDRPQDSSGSRGGDVQAQEHGRVLWRIDARTTVLDLDQFEEMQAWFDSLRGMLNRFAFYDPVRVRPRAYPGTGWAGMPRYGGGAFDGTCSLVATSGYTVALSGLPASYKVMTGDLMCWGWGSTATLHRAMETVTAVNGSIGALTVDPDIPPGSAPGAVVHLENPFGFFSLTEPVAPSRDVFGGQQIAFKARQVLK